MSEIVGPTFGDLQNTVDQITRVLPTAAVTGFHFIAGQISPDSLCTESQVAQCCPPPISESITLGTGLQQAHERCTTTCTILVLHMQRW